MVALKSGFCRFFPECFPPPPAPYRKSYTLLAFRKHLFKILLFRFACMNIDDFSATLSSHHSKKLCEWAESQLNFFILPIIQTPGGRLFIKKEQKRERTKGYIPFKRNERFCPVKQSTKRLKCRWTVELMNCWASYLHCHATVLSNIFWMIEKDREIARSIS